MGTLIGLLVDRGWSERVARAICYAGLVLLILGSVAGLVAAYNAHIIGKHEQKIEARAKPAIDQAATERANDAIANAKHEQEMHDAVHSVPDAPPAGPSHALACERLKRYGRRPPACLP